MDNSVTAPLVDWYPSIPDLSGEVTVVETSQLLSQNVAGRKFADKVHEIFESGNVRYTEQNLWNKISKDKKESCRRHIPGDQSSSYFNKPYEGCIVNPRCNL